MDTTENELQALRKELDAFRNENIALYNELTKQNKILCEQVIALREQNSALAKELTRHHVILNEAINLTNGRNLEIYLRRFVGMQTAEFIVNNMSTVKSFDIRDDYLKYSLSQVGNAVGGGVILGVRRLQRRHHKPYLVDVAR